MLVEVPPTSLPLARCLASQDAQDLLVGLLHTPCNELKSSLLKVSSGFVQRVDLRGGGARIYTYYGTLFFGT